MTKGKSYQRYPAHFKKMALTKAAEDGMTDAKTCEELGVSARQLRRWRDEFRILGDDAFPGQGHSRDEELTKLKKEVAQLKKERDFLKQAAVFFAKESD
jgi:transposase